MRSPLELSLKHLRKLGMRAGIVERRMPFINTTRDLFGVMDILAFSPDLGVIGVQATSRACVKKHMVKYAGDPELTGAIRDWVGTGTVNKFWLLAWKRVKGKPAVLHKYHAMPNQVGGLIWVKDEFEG